MLNMKLRYNNINHELTTLGLTKKEVAQILNISVSTLNYRIQQDKPSIHWIVYGLANYFTKDNLVIEDNEVA